MKPPLSKSRRERFTRDPARQRERPEQDPSRADLLCLMPWLENSRTLREALLARLEATESSQTTSRILVWLTERLDEAAAALTALHTRGLAHLDIKPDNMLIQDDGSLVIADTASCRALRGKDQCGITLTRYFAHPDLRTLLRCRRARQTGPDPSPKQALLHP